MLTNRQRGVARWSLFGAIAISTIGIGLFSPLALLFFVNVTDLSLTTVGALTSAGVLVSLPVPIFAGYLADRFGSRPVVISGQLLQAAGFAGYIFAREQFPVFLAIAVVAVGQRVFWSTFFAMVASADLGEQGSQDLDRRFALVGMVQAAGLGLGALVAGVAIGAANESVYLAITVGNVITFALSGLMLLRVPVPRAAASPDERPSSAKDGYRVLLRDRAYLLLVVGNLPLAICSVLLGTALPVFVAEGLRAPGWVVGPLLALNTVILATGQLAATRVLHRWTRTGALMVAGGVWALWGVMMAVSLALPWPLVAVWLVLAVLVYAAAEIVHAPVSNALAAAAAPEEHRGSYLAIFQYGFTVANMVVPVGFTVLFTANAALPWVATTVLALTAVVLMGLLGRMLPRGTGGGDVADREARVA